MKECKKSMEENIRQIVEELQELSKMAVIQYRSVVNDILDEKVVDEQEIARIMDGMLDFCQFDEILLLFKRLCRGLYPKHPQLVQDYISYYREMWDEEQALYFCCHFRQKRVKNMVLHTRIYTAYGRYYD